MPFRSPKERARAKRISSFCHSSPESSTILSFSKEQLGEATEIYLEIEKRNESIVGAQAVLVAAESLKALRRAYPNYYLDTQVFLRELGRAVR